MTTLNTIIEEEQKKFEDKFKDSFTLGAMESWKDGEVVRDFLTSAMQRAYEAGEKKAREEERERIRKWATSNARTKDTNMSDFPENHEYTVDYHELTDFLSKQL